MGDAIIGNMLMERRVFLLVRSLAFATLGALAAQQSPSAAVEPPPSDARP